MGENVQEVIQQLFERGILVTPAIMQQLANGVSFETILAQNRSTIQTSVEITRSYTKKPSDIKIEHFTQYFANRLLAMQKILSQRQELDNLTTIHRLALKSDKEKISLIGFVTQISVTKNEHIMLTIEDQTGTARVMVLKKDENKELYDQAKNLVLDDIVGINGMLSVGQDRIVFVNQIVLPDIPNGLTFKKAPEQVYAAFTGDIHVGAKVFLHEAFGRFLQWLNQDTTNMHMNAIASKLGYLFVVGDIIEGAGIYPNQEKDLAIMNVKEQYKLAAQLFAKIPSHIKIIICPGNHDTMRLAEPQPPLYKDYALDLLSLPNVVNISSPGIVTIHKSAKFEGFQVLLYHGNSFFYYLDNVPNIRKEGGINRIDLVMEFLLRRRHLAPTHTSNQYIPDTTRDDMFLDIIPDFFASGHIHKSIVANYKHITMLNCSCFVDVTDYQKKQGMVPDLAKVAVIDLSTRQKVILDFEKGFDIA